MRRFCILIVVLFFGLLSLSSLLYAEGEENQNQWPEFARWYEWKKQTPLTKKQMDVLNYLDIASKIFNKADDTRNIHPDSKYGIPDPKQGLAITERSIDELKKLPYPKECKEIRDLNIAELREIVLYQQLRIKYKDGTEDFKKIYEKYITVELENGLGAKRFSTYFTTMRDVGLFDRILEEMVELGLLDRQQFEKFYNYFQEIDSGTTPKCSVCSENMRRIPIVYGQIGEDKIYRKGKIIAMPGGEIDFHGKPKFAYICDKDNKLYEEYPSSSKGKVIIRNWGWGLYNWKYNNKDNRDSDLYLLKDN
jgi:hypothetical protein